MTTAHDADPIARFVRSLDRAKVGEAFDPTRCALATVDAQGRPSSRFVLVKHVDERGFAFFTNLGSRKARDLRDNPRAALCFHWCSIGEQVRVEGPVERVADEEADAYFASRDRGSQLGAWASRQSEPLQSRQQLQDAFDEAERRFAGAAVPRPSFWGGFRVVPERIEFWQAGEHRLHDRLLYERPDGRWSIVRLAP